MQVQFHSVNKPLTQDEMKTYAKIVLQFGRDSERVRPAGGGGNTEVRLITEDELIEARTPVGPVIRMTDRRYIDSFFQDGSIRLGTFSLYTAIEQQEIGDKSEGQFLLFGQNTTGGLTSLLTGGDNYYVLCATNEEPSDKLLESFGHNDYFEIIDTKGFLEAIRNCLNSVGCKSSRCVYADEKVVLAKLPEDYDFSIVSGEIEDVFSEGKYFIKPIDFAHQKEFRFLWKMDDSVEGFIDIKCPEAVRYCRRKV